MVSFCQTICTVVEAFISNSALALHQENRYIRTIGCVDQVLPHPTPPHPNVLNAFITLYSIRVALLLFVAFQKLVTRIKAIFILNCLKKSIFCQNFGLQVKIVQF